MKRWVWLLATSLALSTTSYFDLRTGGGISNGDIETFIDIDRNDVMTIQIAKGKRCFDLGKAKGAIYMSTSPGGDYRAVRKICVGRKER
jgi:hypothetical protein